MIHGLYENTSFLENTRRMIRMYLFDLHLHWKPYYPVTIQRSFT